MGNVVYSGRFLRVEEEEIHGHVFEKVFHKDSVIIFPFNAEGKLLLIEERRIHEEVKVRLKPISGYYENEVTFEENVNRELQEEIGMKAGRIVHYDTARRSGTINDSIHFALAYDLVESVIPNPDPNEEILAVVPVTIDEAYRMALAGRFGLGYQAFILVRLWHQLKPKN